MPSPEFQRRLTAVDAAFLYAERRTAPMQIGAVSVLDGELTIVADAAEPVSPYS